jgi:hypothetical protein
MADPEMADDSASDDQVTDQETLLDTPAKPADESADAGDTEKNDKAADKPDDNELPPEEYAEFAMPEGVEVDSALLDKALPLFKELGMTQANAQKLVDLQAEHVQSFAQTQQDQFSEVITGWADSTKADKEIGGDDFDQNIGIAKTAIEKFGTPELSQFLHDSGAGSHPEIVRMFLKIGKLTQEDQPGSGSPVAKARTLSERLYPNDQPK